MLHSAPDSGFDRVAAFYDPLARLVYGRALQNAQQAALTVGLPAGEPQVLLIGGGTGWVLTEVLRQRPQARILYLEASPQMLAKSRAILARQMPTAAAQVEFRLGTEANLFPTDTFDVIVTFFFLDLFEPVRLRHLVERLNVARRPGSPWLLADFTPPQKWWQRVLQGLMYGFFSLTTGISARRLPAIHAELARLSLRPGSEARFFGGMVEAVVWRQT